MKLPQSRFIKVVLGFIGVVLTGAIGSGLWEIALMPLSNTFRDALLNIVSFAVQSFRSDVYSAISKGHDESMLVLLLDFVFVLAIVLFASGTLFLLSSRKKMRIQIPQLIAEVEVLISEIESGKDSAVRRSDAKENLLRRREELRKISMKRISIQVYAGVAFAIIGLTAISLSFLKENYVNSAITHYNTLVTIATPYVEVNKRELINSRFAQLKTKEDYCRVTAELDSVIQCKGIKPPEFSPW